jgi:integrase
MAETKLLTAREAETLTARGRYADGDNLFLSIGKTGGKSWAFIYTIGGKTREMGLGPFARVPLKGARVKAQECRELLGRGIDPLTVRKQSQPSIPTFAQAAAAYLDMKSQGWRGDKQTRAAAAMLGLPTPKGPPLRQRRLKKVPRTETPPSPKGYCASIASMPVDTIGTEDVLRVLKPLWERAPVSGMLLRNRIENILDRARAHGHIPATHANPARWRGHLEHLLSKRPSTDRRHHAALAYDRIPAFIADLQEMRREPGGAYRVQAFALEFLILTATRSSETLGAVWSEFNLEKRIWTIPPERMKAKRAFDVPLSNAAAAILKEMTAIRVNDFVFPGSRKSVPMHGKTFERLLERLGQSCTTHGFRSAFRDWAGNETHFQREVAEAALAHLVGNAVEQAYRRDDAIAKRRKLMDAWAKYLASKPADNVVAFKRG